MSGFDGDIYEVNGINPLDGSECFGMPRVTTILSLLDKPALRQWAANEAAQAAMREMRKFRKVDVTGIDYDAIYDQARYAYKQVSTDAVDLGSQLHDILENHNRYLRDDEIQMIPDSAMIERWLSDWVAFCGKANLKPLLIEKRATGTGYTGTLDLVAECDYIWFVSRDKKLQAKTREKRITTMFDFKTGKATNYNETWNMQTAAYRRALEDEGMKIDTNCAIRFNKLNSKMARVCDYGETYQRDLERFYCLRDYWWATKYKGE